MEASELLDKLRSMSRVAVAHLEPKEAAEMALCLEGLLARIGRCESALLELTRRVEQLGRGGVPRGPELNAEVTP